MKKIINVLMVWKSIPAMLVYVFLSKDTKNKVDMDIARNGLRPSCYSLHTLLYGNHVFRRIFYVRLLDESIKKYRLVRWTYKPMHGLEISSVTGNIGGGLQVYHGYSTIIFCHSMGENCSVYQNVTLGRGKDINGIDVPIIGNNVTIYTGAIIIGGIKVGDNAVIGAGAVVVKDVPEGAIVIGSGNRSIEKERIN